MLFGISYFNIHIHGLMGRSKQGQKFFYQQQDTAADLFGKKMLFTKNFNLCIHGIQIIVVTADVII